MNPSVLITVSEGLPVSSVLDFLREQKIKHVAIVNDENQISGIFSIEDSAKVLAEGFGAICLEPVSRFMQRQFYKLPLDGDFYELFGRDFALSPVFYLIEKADKVLGIISSDRMSSLLEDYIASPAGSLRTAIETFACNYPNGFADSD